MLNKNAEDHSLSSDDDEDGLRHELPWGVRKKVIEAAPAECKARPWIGDEVSVNYVARLQSNGTEIGAAKDSTKPFRFVVGQTPRQVLEGFDLAVRTMRREEIAEFTIAPRFAYDDLGSPPLVPPDASLVFEVKLLEWTSKIDLFNDDRAVKTIVERGMGENKPRLGQEVLMSLKVVARGGKALEEYDTIQHRVGSLDFGVSSKIVTQALLHMVEGERASVFLRRFAGDTLVDRTLQGATLQISLLRIYEECDVSLAQDGSLVKKILARGSGDTRPHEASCVKLLVSAATDGAADLPGFIGRQILEFMIGDGDVCDTLEAAVAHMKVGEQAVLTCQEPAQCCEARLGLVDLQVSKVLLTVELTEVTRNVDAAALPWDERLSFLVKRKAMGTALFKQQRYRLALERYSKVLATLGTSDDDGSTKELRCACELNRAACLLKLGDNAAAKASCDRVLSWEPEHIKARYRRASAHFALSDYMAAQKDLTELLRQDPGNTEAKRFLTQVKEAQRRYAEDSKAAAARMWGTKPHVDDELRGTAVEPAAPRAFVARALAAMLPCLPLPCPH